MAIARPAYHAPAAGDSTEKPQHPCTTRPPTRRPRAATSAHHDAHSLSRLDLRLCPRSISSASPKNPEPAPQCLPPALRSGILHPVGPTNSGSSESYTAR